MKISELSSMRCDRIVILAAGRASRMKKSAADSGVAGVWASDALNRPKPMIRIGANGEPMLQWILEQSLRAGFTEATIVIGPNDAVTPPFVEGWNRQGVGEVMRVRCVVQSEPRGTGDAVRCAMEEDPVEPGKTWVLCNGDNLPTRTALARLRSVPAGQALLAYDRQGLGLDPAKTLAFAVLKGDGKRIHRIVEKPDEEEVQRMEREGLVRVSMNIFRLDAQALMPFLEKLEPHPTRGELELPSAIQAMMDAGMTMEQMNISEEVLDLTRLQDVASVQDGAHLLDSFTLEVCASSPEDVGRAAEGGAQRIELCAHWECGGLTPPEADVRLACQWGLPLHVLIRCRAGHFVYSDQEKEQMTRQIEAHLEAGACRVVVGALDLSGRLDLGLLSAWADTFGAHRLVVHRALDAATDWEHAVDGLKSIGIHRVLSSGGAATAWEGKERIVQLHKQGFDVTVGSGVKPEQRDHWMAQGIRSFHASCREKNFQSTRLFDGTANTVSNEQVAAWFR